MSLQRTYIYPPRPENNFPATDLDYYDNGTYIAQPKLNGSCGMLYMPDEILMNRHKQELTNMKLSYDEYRKVFGTNDNVIVGEYMNKSKKDENCKTWNQKFVIFDQLIHDGNYLLKTTFEERYDLIQKLYPAVNETKWLYQISENIWMVKSFTQHFKEIWNELVKIDMFEGLVLKRRNAKLERGTTGKNNHRTQLKCRKSTKNYGY